MAVDVETLAAIVAAGLAQNNANYRKCVRRGDFNLQRDPVYELDLDAIAKDAMTIANKFFEIQREAIGATSSLFKTEKPCPNCGQPGDHWDYDGPNRGEGYSCKMKKDA